MNRLTLFFFIVLLYLLTTGEQGREKKANKFEQSGMTLEELERLQAEQFAAAAARHT